MAWTTPKTDWATGELVAASDMNAIGENLAALDTVRETVAAHTMTEDIAITDQREFVDADSSNLNLTITTAGGDVLVHFHGEVRLSGRAGCRFDIAVDGIRQGGDDGIGEARTWNSAYTIASFSRLIQNLSAGSHTFKLQVKSGGSVNMRRGAQFWVREI